MKLKRFGFFADMPKDEAARLLENLQSEQPRPNEQAVLTYLRGGRQLLAIPGLSRNLLNPEKEIIGPPHVFSDGEWVWTADAIFYVEKYHIGVPADFLYRMEHQRWQCPPVDNPQELVLAGW